MNPCLLGGGRAPPTNALFRLVDWNADGSGANVDIGFLDSGPTGAVEFAVPLRAVFALTSAPIGSPLHT